MFSHIDCFAGPGGICTGMHAAGFETKVAIECIKSCVETYSANHPEVHVIHSDIRQVTPEQILPYIPGDGVDIVSSGMPCETFSTAGNTSRSFYDDRQFLFREGIRIAKMANAKLILFENVPAITTKTVEKHSNELIVNVLKKELTDAGYGNYIEVVLSATQFGVPQRRNHHYKQWPLISGAQLLFLMVISYAYRSLFLWLMEILQNIQLTDGTECMFFLSNTPAEEYILPILILRTLRNTQFKPHNTG